MKHLIKIETTEHGALSVSHMGKDQQWCDAGLSVFVNNQPDAGWGLQKLYYIVAGSSEKHPIDIATRTFIMPNGNITIGGVFKRFVIGDWTEGKGNQEDKAVFVKGEDGEPRSIPVDQFIDTITDAELDNDSERPVQNKVVTAALGEKQDNLVSGQNIKTLNGESLLGNSNIVIEQHFKGWWPDLDTLKAAVTAEPGDYAYVADESPATTTSIYVYDANAEADNYWADSGRDVDTSNVQSFLTGEQVNQTGIYGTPQFGSTGLVSSGGMKNSILDIITSDSTGYAKEILSQDGNIKYDDGSEVASGYKRSDKIKVKEGNTIILKTKVSNTVASLAAYTSSDVYLQSESIKGSNSLTTSTYIVPSGVDYIRISCHPNDVDSFELKIFGNIVDLERNINLLMKYYPASVTEETGYLINKSGVKTSNSGYKLFTINLSKHYTVILRGVVSKTVAAIALYDSVSDTYTPVKLGRSRGGEIPDTYTYTAPESCTIVLSANKSYDPICKVVESGEINEIFLLLNTLNDVVLDSDIQLGPVSINLFDPSKVLNDTSVTTGGTINTEAAGWATAVIPVVAGKNYTFGGALLGRSSNCSFFNGLTMLNDYPIITETDMEKGKTVNAPVGANILYITIKTSVSPENPYDNFSVNEGDVWMAKDSYKEGVVGIGGNSVGVDSAARAQIQRNLESITRIERSLEGTDEGVSLDNIMGGFSKYTPTFGLIVDLPQSSDGTGIGSGFVYVDSNNNIKIKQ